MLTPAFPMLTFAIALLAGIALIAKQPVNHLMNRWLAYDIYRVTERNRSSSRMMPRFHGDHLLLSF
jgi:hypothetical protein